MKYSLFNLKLKNKIKIPSVALKGFDHIVTVQYFNPVIVRILDKSQSFHFTIIRFLHKIDAQTFKSLAGLFNVRNHDSDVTEHHRVRSVSSAGILEASTNPRKYRENFISGKSSF